MKTKELVEVIENFKDKYPKVKEAKIVFLDQDGEEMNLTIKDCKEGEIEL